MTTNTNTSSIPDHLRPDREIHVVISTLSGHRKAESYYNDTLKPFLDSYNLQHSVHRTTSTDSINQLTKSTFLFNARRGVKQTIILLSGDGGIVDIVNTFATNLMRDTYDTRAPSIFFKPVIALIPMGTANALAWSAGIAQDPLKVLMNGRPKPLPIFEVKASTGTRQVTNEGHGREVIPSDSSDYITAYGAVVFSWCVHASLVALSDTTEYRKHGLERFKMAAQQLLENPHTYKGRVRYRPDRNEEWQDLTLANSNSQNEYSYVLAAMVSNLEEHFRISPSSQPVSDSMYLVSISPEPSQEVMRLLGLAYQGGRHVDETNVTYKQIDSLRIDFEEDDEQWRQICIDGKILAVDKGGWVEVRKLPGSGMDGRRVVDLLC